MMLSNKTHEDIHPHYLGSKGGVGLLVVFSLGIVRFNIQGGSEERLGGR